MEAAAALVFLLGFTGLASGGGVLPDSTLVGVVGGAVNFITTLTPSETPFASVTWKFGDKNIIISDVVNTTFAGYQNRVTFFPSTRSLELRNLVPGDSGEYKVIIVTHGEAVKHGNAHLEVYVPVSDVGVFASNTNLLEHGSTVFTCSASGSSLFYRWMNGSSEVTVSSRVQLTQEGRVLTIGDVLRYDEGPFSCTAFNSASSASSSPTSLSISYGPENTALVLSPSQEYFERGSNINMSCSADSSPEPTYTWTFLPVYGPPTVPNPAVKVNWKEMLNVTERNSGNYSCTAFNIRTEISASSPARVVSVLGVISNTAITATTNLPIEGEAVNLTCDAAGDVFTIEWMKNGASNLSLADNLIFYEANRVLSFRPVRRTDSGDFSCRVSNPVSTEEAAFSMAVNYGPENAQVTGPSESQPGQTFTLNCSAESQPSADYAWILNGTEIHSSPVYTKENAGAPDSGNYTCRVSNNVTGRSVDVTHVLTLTAHAALSAGAIAGITIAVVVVVALAAAAGGFLIFKRGRVEIPNVEMEITENVYEDIDTVYENVYQESPVVQVRGRRSERS